MSEPTCDHERYVYGCKACEHDVHTAHLDLAEALTAARARIAELERDVATWAEAAAKAYDAGADAASDALEALYLAALVAEWCGPDYKPVDGPLWTGRVSCPSCRHTEVVGQSPRHEEGCKLWEALRLAQSVLAKARPDRHRFMPSRNDPRSVTSCTCPPDRSPGVHFWGCPESPSATASPPEGRAEGEEG